MDLKMNVTGNKLTLLGDVEFVEGNIGYYNVSFDFSSEWNELIKHIVVTSKNGCFDAVIEDDSYKLPVAEEGILHIGVWGEDTSAETRISTNMIYIKVKPGAYNGGLFPEMDAYAWSVYHKLVLSYTERAKESAKSAEASARSADEILQNVAELEDEANNAAKVACDSAGSAQSYSVEAYDYKDAAEQAEDLAQYYSNVAEQALLDLLSMIQSGDIVLASNGKLPLSSIPATATQEIYIVESENELTSLEAQRGDLAELIEEINGVRKITKTWQCLGDSTKRNNWVEWGTSYAVSAGNAEHSENAGNSARINGHRLVEMSESEFENAVKDDDTYYLVY